ncbi:sugar phosphate isomerase/epimerase family protein [Planctomycetota bacterium]
MKIGITQLCIPGTVAEVITKVTGWGYEVIELGMKTEGGILNLSQSAQEQKDMAAQISDAGLDLVSLVGSPVQEAGSMFAAEKGSRDAAHDACREVVDTAVRMGADTVLLVPGRLTGEVCYDEAMDLLIESLRAVAPYAEQAGISLAIEQVWNKFLVSPMDMKTVIEGADSKAVGVYMDTGNMLFWNYPEHWIRILAAYIKKIHFKDFTREGMTLKFVPLREGDVNWDAVMTEIRAAGYDGPVISEVGGEDEIHARMAEVMKEIIS